MDAVADTLVVAGTLGIEDIVRSVDMHPFDQVMVGVHCGQPFCDEDVGVLSVDPFHSAVYVEHICVLELEWYSPPGVGALRSWAVGKRAPDHTDIPQLFHRDRNRTHCRQWLRCCAVLDAVFGDHGTG